MCLLCAIQKCWQLSCARNDNGGMTIKSKPTPWIAKPAKPDGWRVESADGATVADALSEDDAKRIAVTPDVLNHLHRLYDDYSQGPPESDTPRFEERISLERHFLIQANMLWGHDAYDPAAEPPPAPTAASIRQAIVEEDRARRWANGTPTFQDRMERFVSLMFPQPPRN